MAEAARKSSFMTTLRSILSSRAELAQRAGLTFDGKRDMAKALGYQMDLTVEDFWTRYRRNPVAARVVEAYPQGTWRGTGELIEDPKIPDYTTFEQEWFDLSKRLKVWPTLRRADILAGLGRFSVVLIGAPGALASPLSKELGPNGVVFLSAFSERDVEVKQYVTDVTNPRFGEPEVYSFKRLTPSDPRKPITISKSQEKEVHWTRVIHLSDGLLEDNVFGQPRLERVWNRLDDLEKIVGAGAEAFWLRAHQGYQFNLDKEMEIDESEEEALDEQTEDFVNGLSRVIRTRGLDVKPLGSDVAMFDRNVESVLGLIAAGTGIPQRILSGSERGQLASQQDRVNWTERVKDRRTEYAGPLVLDQLVKRLIDHGGLSRPKDYEIRWPDVFDLSDDERAIIAARWAEINQRNKKVTVTVDEIRDRILGLPPLPKEEQVWIPTGTGTTNDGQADPDKERTEATPPITAPANPADDGRRS